MGGHTVGPAIDVADAIAQDGPQFDEFVNEGLANDNLFFLNFDLLIYLQRTY